MIHYYNIILCRKATYISGSLNLVYRLVKMKRKHQNIDGDHEADDDSSDDEDVESTMTGSSKIRYTNKQRVLIVASRGITARHRHLLEDLKMLIPHHRKDSKLDSKGLPILPY